MSYKKSSRNSGKKKQMVRRCDRAPVELRGSLAFVFREAKDLVSVLAYESSFAKAIICL